jgi:peptidoglycan/xylan/chitin deacetylase (PgdA/CDA1 family)
VGNLRQRRWGVLPALSCIVGVSALAGGCVGSPRGPTAIAPRSTWTLDQGGIVRGDLTEKRIALIFTGGDYGEGTAFILDTLRQAGIQGSFFVTGHYLSNEDHRALLHRMVAEGHYLGPHSDTHPLYCPWDDRSQTLVTQSFFEQDLRKNIADLRQFGALANEAPIYFIPPYEWFNADQVRWSQELGITLFNFSPGSGSNRDWIPEGERGFVSSAAILADILAYERTDPHGLNGFILLLHLGALRQDKMHTQLPALVAELFRRGYRFARVDELLRSSVR